MADIKAHCGKCGRAEVYAHGARCGGCERDAERWVERTITVWLDEGTFGSAPDEEEFAYLLRMGGIDAESPREHRRAESHRRLMAEAAAEQGETGRGPAGSQGEAT